MLFRPLLWLSATMHAFWHGLFRPKDAKLVRRLHRQVVEQFAAVGLRTDQDRLDLVAAIATEVSEAFDLDVADDRTKPIFDLTAALISSEKMFTLPDVDWSQRHTIAELWDIRDYLTGQQKLVADFDFTRHMIKQLVGHIVDRLHEQCPGLYAANPDSDGIAIETTLLDSIRDISAVVGDMLGVVGAEDLVEAGLFGNLREQLAYNLVIASGGDPADPKAYQRQPTYPDKFNAKSNTHLVQTYLANTPLLSLFDQPYTLTIPTKARFEHHHIVAGSGHGKTQTLQYMLLHDLEAVARGERSVVVIDSQGDLISNIANLEVFAPDGPLADRLVIIDPTDIEYPVSLNLFDVGTERIANYGQLERERLTNSILELYDFVLGSLLDAEMTQKQSVIFRYVTRLMLHIPDATIHTLKDLMEPNAEKRFAQHIETLSGTAKDFFKTQFNSKEFEQTKSQVLRRLWGILENQTFERMFSHPLSKLQLYDEMNASKVILINTAKDLLKENGTQIFGRFFIAMIAQAAQERAVLPQNKRLPTFVYIDEAADYFDHNIQTILEQARKFSVGMVLSHQFMGQLGTKLEQAIDANTSIKFAGGVSAKDAKTLAGMMHCDPEIIQNQPKLSFAASMRGVHKGAVPLHIPLGAMEKLPTMSPAEREAVRSAMRCKYATHYTKLAHKEVQREAVKKPEQPDQQPEKPAAGHVDTDAGEQW